MIYAETSVAVIEWSPTWAVLGINFERFTLLGMFGVEFSLPAIRLVPLLTPDCGGKEGMPVESPGAFVGLVAIGKVESCGTT